ncbi:MULTISPECIES: bifunctional proline dehydrogenase/L-glutamate gamma-semialdehyde dehydrogenase [unclassified Microbacterium]|uniref:bifunctional proline dehydrogenase/L-glutamate gamma-semialdehyde dehydrogenase n=2 Tax=Microbacterium TaxID=33882 RepID=UPI0024695617|nr:MULTISPECIES: bifunctional proline dehydrogenase/L-glutamate gamma-semialdehyde dehydrogenase [unclassified Microbacterium]MDH5134184.1 bifunctional proline dehydrogenase/L-glutamate gamma-semialdehyde dehydrogenase [Microbacterium sp. RD10]MDH5137624.1 bifunctional proline dehydrogenase/L-glutamate gamma-semialdehyde dehydrogenase [Microbacterium sp. RD11]MDH5143814.1 bifunctional proline dehydrogenase/L-glutamate gamma-semialdehyde dehydrogenase [Microbacterium sp. RD12]MDH5154695.1 bifunc
MTVIDDTTPRTEEVAALVQRWLAESETHPVEPAAQRLSEVLKDPNGLDFTVGFVDGVMRPEDLRVAGRKLAELSDITPTLLPGYLRAAIKAGGFWAPKLPNVVVPISRRVLRAMVGHLVLDATPSKLGPAIAKLRKTGNRLNLNLLGEAVLGEREAGRRLQGTYDFLARPDVDYVSIKVSSVVSQLSMWSFDEAVADVVEKLTPLYRLAAKAEAKGARTGTQKFINLDMEEYRDLDLTIAAFTSILDQPGLEDLEAGIVLQAYLPDALGAMQRLQEWAAARRAKGGAPIKVRVVKGANLAMEEVDAKVHGWPLATYGTKQDSDTNYKRVLDWAMTPERLDAVRIGVAGHNLFDIAYTWLLAKARGVTGPSTGSGTQGQKGALVEYEMLLGMATGQAEAVRKDVGRLLLYTPVVNPAEFDVAIAYLVRRLEENASPENFMSAVFELASNPTLLTRERERFERSLAALVADPSVPGPNRTQDRTAPRPAATTDGFANEPDTDPALAANRAWGREILQRSVSSTLGRDAIAAARIETDAELDAVFAAATSAAEKWAALPAAERAAVLHRAGDELAARRGELLEIMAHEAGKTIAEADPEVSEAIDFAHYYAERAKDLEAIPGAEFVPSKVTVVTPPWNFPVAIPAGGVLAGLASGSGVIIKPAKLTQRCGAVMVEALWAAGVPRDLLALVDLASRDLGTRLVASPQVDRVILTGAYETAQLFRSFRADLPLLAETSGKNAIIVTPSADLDLAAADVARSAFGHAGQKCSAASLAILVGSVADSKRFERQLVDAVTSMRVGLPDDPATQMGPIIEPANGKLLTALTTLDKGERWLVEPRKLDDEGKQWTPGVKTGVREGSYFHLTEFFGPVLGIMHAKDLDEAIRLQNAVDYGLTAGLHSLDSAEVATWLDRVEAGNLYVNRGITGAIVQRQPFGGWKRSAVGAGAKAGGPNYLFGLGEWRAGELPAAAPGAAVTPAVTGLLEAAAPELDPAGIEWLHRAAAADERAWIDEFGAVSDKSGLGVERNVFRYRPVAVDVRVAEDTPLAEGVRVLAAALRSGSPFTVSAASLPSRVEKALKAQGVTVKTESDAAWTKRYAKGARSWQRVRLVGGDAGALHTALDGSPDVAVWSHAVTGAGRVEMLPFLREQAVSITNHRFGNPTTLSEGIL